LWRDWSGQRVEASDSTDRERPKGTTEMTSKRRTRRTLDELGAASDHLFYEWRMLSFLEQELAKEDDRLRRNAFIESAAIHARNLVKFLYNTAHEPRKDDVIAGDFFPTLDFWRNARPPMPKVLQDEHFGRHANKQIAHMTYSGRPKKEWHFASVADGIQIALHKFVGMIGIEQLGDRWRTSLPQRSGPRWDELKRIVREKEDLGGQPSGS